MHPYESYISYKVQTYCFKFGLIVLEQLLLS